MSDGCIYLIECTVLMISYMAELLSMLRYRVGVKKFVILFNVLYSLIPLFYYVAN